MREELRLRESTGKVQVITYWLGRASMAGGRASGPERTHMSAARQMGHPKNLSLEPGPPATPRI